MLSHGSTGLRRSKTTDSRRYTWDVLQLDKAKWDKEFKGNHVYLVAYIYIYSLLIVLLTCPINHSSGGIFDLVDIIKFFYPNHADPHSFKYPPDHLFCIQGCIDVDGMKKPYVTSLATPASLYTDTYYASICHDSP